METTHHNAALRLMIRRGLVFLFFLLLPWQTRWIFGETLILDEVSQYGRLSVYLFDVALVLLLVSARSLFRFDRLKERFSSPWWKRFALAALGLIGLAVASIAWSPAPLVSLMAAVHLVLALALLAYLLLDRTIHPITMLAGLAIGLLIPGVLGWVQSGMQEVVASTVFGLAAQTPDTLGVSVIEHAGGRWLRAYGSFPHPNMFGGAVAIGLLGAVIASTLMKRAVWEYVYLVIAVLLSGALVLSASRAAWLAYLLGLVVVFGGCYWIRARSFCKRLRFPAGISLLVMAILTVSLHGILVNRFDASNRVEAISTEQRTAHWQEFTDVWLASPGSVVFGTGLGAYTFALNERQPLRPVWEYQPVHNVPALILAELGIVGFALVVLMVVSVDVGTHRRWRRPASVIALALGTTVVVLALFDHYLWTQPSGLYVLAVFFAVSMRLSEPKTTPRNT